MKPWLERTLYFSAIAVLILVLAHAGRTQAKLNNEIPYTPQTLLRQMASSAPTLQLIDVRPTSGGHGADAYDDDDDDDVGGFEDAHIPGAIPFPNCDETQTDEVALAQSSFHIPTVIVSKDGSREIYDTCLSRFTLARNLLGGMTGWLESGYPEDDGEYAPPPMGSGGGCL